MNAELLLAHFDRIGDAPNAIPRLRRFIFQLAVRGKLVEQDPTNEPASALARRLQAEKAELTLEGKGGKARSLIASEVQDVPYEIPKNWKWVRLAATVNKHFGGGTPSKNVSAYWEGDIYWASVKDVGKGKYIDQTIDRISDAGLADSSSNLIPPGNLIIVTRMGLGKVSINRVPIAINQDLRALCLSSLVVIDYHYIFFKTHGFVGTGLTVKGIKVEELLSIAFPLPPLAEQRRIVAKVEELMAHCDRLEAAEQEREARHYRLVAASNHHLRNGGNAENVRSYAQFYLRHLPSLAARPDHIKPLRHTILSLAIRGQLTREDGESVPELSLNSGFPSDWSIEPLIKVASDIVDCPHSTPKWTTEGKLCVRTNQFRPGRLDLSEVRFVSESTYLERIQRLEPVENDILYSREGGILGIACRVPPNTELCLGQRMMLIRAGARVDPLFLEMVLNSPLVTKIALEKTTGGAAPRINVSTVKAYPIPIPPLDEQNRIVAKVNELMALCDRLEVQLATVQEETVGLLESVLYHALYSSASRSPSLAPAL
jgi:type I restriction enzyme S subunit